MKELTRAEAEAMHERWIMRKEHHRAVTTSKFAEFLEHEGLIKTIEPPTLLEVCKRVVKLLALGHDIDDELLARFIEAIAREEAKDD